MFAKVNPRTMTPVNNTDHRGGGHVAILAGFVPLDYLLDLVSIGTLVAFIMVSVGVIILRVREPDLPRGFKVPGYPVTPDPLGARLRLDAVRPALVHLGVVRRCGWPRSLSLLLVLEPPPQRAQCRWRRRLYPDRGSRRRRCHVR